MSEELKPCPFCGGEAEIRTRKVHHSDWFGKNYRAMYRARCKSCGATVGKLAACEYHRDERTGSEWGAIVEWNARAERTCKPQGEWERVSQTQEIRHVYCECGEYFGADERDSFPFAIETKAYLPNYCPNCGAKVVCK